MSQSKPKIQIKRVYEPPASADGVRVLVDRIWPRGLSKERAQIEYWKKQWAPSTALRQWFAHDPEKWDAFQQRYKEELRQSGVLPEIESFMTKCESDTVTLVFAAKDTQHNNAAALQTIINQ